MRRPDSSVAGRAAFALLCTIACGNATADWTLVGGNARIYSAYADKGSVKRAGDNVRMYGLYDFQMVDVAPTGQPHESTIVLREYDCAMPRVRLLAFVDYAGHMGEGAVISRRADESGARWETIVSGALDEAFWTLACGR